MKITIKNSLKRWALNRSLRALSMLFVVLILASCEDVIEVELEQGPEALVVDAWIDNLDREQAITLNLSQPYFDNAAPPAVVNASVTVVRADGSRFEFIHREDGRYVWDIPGSSLGEVGDSFQLEIDYNGKAYTAASEIRRVPEIDSIGLEFRDDQIFSDDGIYAQFYARDFSDKGDTYWIKTFHNGEYLDKTQELNIAFDAGFDEGTGVDGLVFIPPIRELVNQLDEDLLAFPYVEGDHIRVEIHSISNEAFSFLEIARDQINNGDNGIFSIPLANPRTNVMSSDGSLVLGFFNVAGITTAERTVE